MKVLRQRITRREDPRSRARRWVGRLVLLAGPPAVVLALGWGAWRVLTHGALLEVREVRVEGCSRAEAERLAVLASDFRGRNLLRVDLEGVRARLESDPWVRRATVRREIPHAIRARVETREADAVARIGGRLWLVAAEGVALGLFREGADRPGPPILEGLDRVPPARLRERLRSGALAARGVRQAGEAGARIASLDLSREGWIQTREGTEGPVLQLPARAEPEETAEALRRWSAIRAQAVSLEGVPALADLRFRDQIGIVPTHREAKGW